MATQYSNKPIVTDGLVYALDFGNPKSYVSGSATAQSLIYRPTPARFETLLPGDYGTPAAAYSVRKVVSSYTGSAMMVQSASVSQSIGFDANGNLDTASLASFAGSGDAFVKIWYDQSGNGRDASQITTAKQPKIYSGSQGSVILENGKPFIHYTSGGTNILQTSFSFNIATPLQIFCISKNTRVGVSYLYDFTVNRAAAFYNPDMHIYNGNTLTSSNLNTNVLLASHLFNGSNSQIHVNSLLLNTGNAGTLGASGNLYIGSRFNVADNVIGGFHEFLLYPSNQSSNRLKIEDNINRYYQIYTSSYNPIPDPDNDFLYFTDESVLKTQQTFPGFSYNQGNSTIMYVGETKGNSTTFTQDGTLSIVSTTSSVGFGSPSNNFGRSYPVTGLKHVTLRFSSGSVDCFVNGIPVSASAIFPTGSSIAGGQLNIPLYTGSLGGFQIYNRPLTSDEIWNNYQLSAPRYGLGPLQNKPYTLDENAYLFLQSAGITDPIITGSIDTFVRGLKSASLWDKMIAIYPFVGTGSTGINLTGSHRWNLKEPSLVTYPLTFTGSWIGSTSGSAPSGSNTNISTQVTPSNYYPFYNTQSAHISILSYDTPVSSSYLMGTGMTEDLAVSTLAGDYGTPAAAYSVRKVRTAYSGALMDVRRDYDNVTSSIGYVSNGDLDTGSLLDWVVPGRNTLPGTYSGLAAAYSLRRVSASYDGYAVRVRGDIENQFRDIGFDASGNLDTGSLLNFTATGSNTLPGSYSGLSAAYSLRKVVAGYAGDAIEVQSGSVSQSIGFDSLGNLDTGSLLTFAGSGNAFVKTWYDQSGNGYHASQLVNSRQPQIASNGVIITENSKPALSFDGADDFLTASFAYNINTLGVQKVERWRNLNNGQVSTTFTQDYGPYLQWIQNNQTFENYYNSGQTDSPATTTRKLYSFYTSIGFYENGTLTVSRPSVRSFVGNTVVIGAFESSFPASVNTQELLIYTSSQASNRTYIENNINAYYDIYTTASTSTENAFVNTWYDQSGNGRHATQTATGSQPLIVSSGSLVTENGKPALRFDNDYLISPSFSIPQPYTVFMAQRYYSTNIQYLVDFGIDVAMGYVSGTGGKNDIYFGNYLYSNTDVSTSTSNLWYALGSGSNSQVSVNNENTVTGNAGTTGVSKITIGARGTTTQGLSNATYNEILLYSTNQSSSRTLIENNINNYYNIYTGSNHGFVARWYDQSGNNRHASQTTANSRQPIIVESGSLILERGRPLIKSLDTTTNLLTPLDFNIQLKAYNVIKTTGKNVLFGSDDASDAILVSDSGSSNSTINAGAVTVNLQRRNGSTYAPANRDTVYNNFISSSLYYLDATYNYTTDNCFGYDKGGNIFGMYSMQESVFYLSTLTQDPSIIEYGINSYYNIYPQTSSFATSSFTIKADSGSISASLNNRLTSGIAASGPLGLITVSRTGSNSLTIARNGVTSSFAVPASGALSTGIYLGAINNNGLALGNSPLNISFASVGTGLTGDNVSTLSNLVGTLNLNLGRAKLIDAYAGAAAAYSLRQLSNSYTGPAIEVRRSNDNASASIGFTPTGDLDTAALQTFVGSNSAFVKTWYDQSGNGRHGIQTDNALQPHIVTSGIIIRQNGKPALNFPDRTDWLDTTSFPIDSSKGMFFVYVDNPIAYVGSKVYTFGGYGTGGLNILDNQFRVNGNILGSFPTEAANIAYRVKSYYTTGNTAFVSFNGQIITTQTFTPFTIPSPVSLASIGRSTVGGAEPLYGTLQEMILYNVDKSEVKSNIEANINNYYRIY